MPELDYAVPVSGDVVGVDPGLSGAIVVLREDGSLRSVIDIPVREKRNGNGNEVDPTALYTALYSIRDPGVLPRTFIEFTSARPGQASHSMYNFGDGCGVLRACLELAKFPMTYITPQKWKKAVGLDKTIQHHALQVAKKLIPESDKYLARKKDIGRADAMLIAYYGLKLREPN